MSKILRSVCVDVNLQVQVRLINTKLRILIKDFQKKILEIVSNIDGTTTSTVHEKISPVDAAVTDSI